MMKRMIQLLGLILGGMLGMELHRMISGALLRSQGLIPMTDYSGMHYMSMVLGGLGGWIFATLIAGPLLLQLRRGAEQAAQLPTGDLISGGAGLISGLAVAALIFPAMSQLQGAWLLLPAAVTLILGYMGFAIGWRKREAIAAAYDAFLLSREPKEAPPETPRFEEHKILDTSVIIDGRIADICKTGFIEGTLVIPEFVLEELQHIADSSDLLKRNRGRRGLDILNKIQKELNVHVLIYEGDFDEIGEVDSKLVKLAKVLGGKVVTNDFNLNKVCELQGVSVLNINDLANSVKPVVLPGEEIVVQVIKDGKEHGQGVAYLDDGTMIVVEGGRDYIGMTMEVLVTSVLQTSAGRMIFAKPKLLERAQ